MIPKYYLELTVHPFQQDEKKKKDVSKEPRRTRKREGAFETLVERLKIMYDETPKTRFNINDVSYKIFNCKNGLFRRILIYAEVNKSRRKYRKLIEKKFN